MTFVFEIEDKTGRKIHLSKERWKHITQEHPEISSYINDFELILKNPTKIVSPTQEISYYYKYYKQIQSKYLLLLVKYLNGKGFIITAYFTQNIK